MRSLESADYCAALQSELDQARGARLAIPLSGHPDPDAMASGWALAELAARAGLTPSLLFARPVSHAENRLMVTALGVPLARFDAAQATAFDAYALVDTHEIDPAYGVMAELPCLAIWDHHDGEPSHRPKHAEMRTDVGATSTIATEHLRVAGLLEPDASEDLHVGEQWPQTGGSGRARLATALLIGIASDTEDYLLAHVSDHLAAARLLPLANRPLYRRIHRRAYTVAAMLTLERALSGVVVRGTMGVAWVGQVSPEERDTIPQAADLLVSRDDLDTALVFGRVGDTIDGSLRTLNPSVSPAQLIRDALGSDARGRPFGGGREGKGGFRLPLTSGSIQEIEGLRKRVEQSFLAVAPTLPRMR